ncbi:hypothetical protein H5410_045005 [Solanum commersonii]|uniref:Uncharacterized protein n=1 Tax=Solanum commersonii TaxID=4109 RepID=A0A9J5X8I1_SOLCO|nr:hypothetical protein H5410_045005 [Solanum commersonii]
MDRMNRIENLQYAVVGKITYYCTDLEELRNLSLNNVTLKGLSNWFIPHETHSYSPYPSYCEKCIMQGHNKEECRIGNIQKGGVPNKSNVAVQKGKVVDNEKAIMIITNLVQIGETNSINVFSLNRVLLDIVSHRLKEENEIQTEGSMTEVDISEELQDYLLIKEDVSPKLLKSSKREKNQGNGKDNQPIRVHPMISKSITRDESFYMEY